jgi:LysR family transcriptional regulator, pca operon transcriptional activator
MRNTDRLKIRHLRALVAVSEHGTLVRAAAALSITQPAVSKTLAELEDIVGRRLLERTRKGVTLTAAGRVLLRHAGASLRALSDGLDSLAGEQDSEGAALLVGALPNVAATVLPPAVLRLLAARPRTRLTVRTGSNARLIAALRQGVLDLVIGRLAEPSDMQGLSFEQFYAEPLLLVVRAGHPLAARRRIEPALLRQHRMVLPDAGTRVREAADRFFVSSGMGMPLQALETIDLAFGRSFVLQSDAVWFVPLGVVENELREGALVRLPIDTQITEGPVGLTRRVDHVASDALQDLVREIRASAAHRLQAQAAEGPARPQRERGGN